MNRNESAALDRWITTEPAWRSGVEEDELGFEGQDELPDDIPDWWEAEA